MAERFKKNQIKPRSRRPAPRFFLHSIKNMAKGNNAHKKETKKPKKEGSKSSRKGANKKKK